MKPFIFRKVLQAVGLLLLAFILLRIVGPWLIDMHDTLALVVAAVLLVAGAALIAWYAWDLITSLNMKRNDDA